MRRLAAVVAVGLLCGWVGVRAQSVKQTAAAPAPALKQRLDQIASAYLDNKTYMGTALVVEADDVLLDKGYGKANLDWDIPNAPDVKFRLGSLTKQFTAALVLLLQQDGKLSVDDPVSKYVPDAPAAWEKITLKNLLGHTSGIPNLTNGKEFGPWAANSHTHAEELAFFKDKPLEFEPGSKFEYSNSNYEVLGMVIEKVSGEKYDALLRKRLFEPLGMHDTGLDSDELILPKRALGYRPSKNGLVYARSESMSVPWAAGSMYSTTHDLLLWERGLFGGKVVNADSLTAMTTPGKGDYGMGLGIRDKDGVKVIDHGGGIEGFNTELMYVPEKKITIVVLSNVNGAAPGNIANMMLDTLVGKTVVLPSEHKAVAISAAELQKFAGTYELTKDFALTFTVSGDALVAQATNQPAVPPLMYEGVREGHPMFYAAQVEAEVEFVPDANGAFPSMILHQNGDHTGKKRVDAVDPAK